MPKVFNKLAVAITFSPTSVALLRETLRLQKLFDSELLLIHSGRKNDDNEKRLNELIEKTGMETNSVHIDWVKGEPGDSILLSAKSNGIDLIIAGALERENIIKYYIGSVARKLMRESDCSVLIFKSPSENPSGFKKFYIDMDFTTKCEMAIKKSFEFAKKEMAEEFVLIRDYKLYGVDGSMVEFGEISTYEAIKEKIRIEEEEKMKIFVRELNLKGLNIKTVYLYGREGITARDYALKNEADIFVVTAPATKLRLLDRLFPHEQEYSFEFLPSNLLIIKNS
ncbi:MAG TPA: universal stress protein [Ignavibacteriaceae bacterium]